VLVRGVWKSGLSLSGASHRLEAARRHWRAGHVEARHDGLRETDRVREERVVERV
jgi:hypothetical protein